MTSSKTTNESDNISEGKIDIQVEALSPASTSTDKSTASPSDSNSSHSQQIFGESATMVNYSDMDNNNKTPIDSTLSIKDDNTTSNSPVNDPESHEENISLDYNHETISIEHLERSIDEGDSHEPSKESSITVIVDQDITSPDGDSLSKKGASKRKNRLPKIHPQKLGGHANKALTPQKRKKKSGAEPSPRKKVIGNDSFVLSLMMLKSA